MSAVSLLRHIGPYEVVRKLGSGGMAVVYEARHVALGKRVALKVRHLHALDDESTARFLREGRAVARIQHPHVIEIFDSGVHEGVPYLAMPLLEGMDLAAYLRERGPLPLAQAIAVALPVVSAVAAAHAAGVVHRDLKPANIFMVRRGGGFHPVVLDFGISKPIDDGPVDLTHSAEVLGTAHYMAPEQTRGARHADARSDQYSLGAILYECSTGERPFEGESSYELMHAVMTAAVVAPSELEPALPAAFDRIVERAMSRVPASRFASVTELGRALIALADAPTRKAWQAELAPLAGDARESAPPTVLAPEGSGGTFRDAPPVSRAVMRRSLPRSLAAAAVALLAAAAFTTALVRARHASASHEGAAESAPEEPVGVASVVPSPSQSPAVVPSPSQSPAVVVAATPSPAAPAVKPREPAAVPRRLLVPSARAASAPPASVAPVASAARVERGPNGSPILQ